MKYKNEIIMKDKNEGLKKYKNEICLYVLQHTATHCNTLQHTATHCNTLQHRIKYDYNAKGVRQKACLPHHHPLQHTATHCNTLQHTATHYNTLPASHIRSFLASIVCKQK